MSGGDAADTGGGWDSILQSGVSALIDSQVAKNYTVSQPAYNTQLGVAGQPQGFAALTSNPLVLVLGVVLVGIVVVAVVRK